MALGADRGDVIRMVLRETLVLMVAGLALGLPAALGAMRLIDATLVGVSATDPVIAGAAILALLAVGLCAGGIPAARASHVDPVAALRRD
jgi:ABC-type antimicrobial peptide transport system permease subunit